MTITKVKKLTEDEAKKQLNALIDLNDYLDNCKTCCFPEILQRGNVCMRGNRAELDEECRI